MLQKVHMKIYVASSWRCERQPAVVAALRAAGHEVYDFKNPAPGQSGFGWKQITPTPPPWSASETISVLSNTIADAGFKFDMDAMRWCDALVMVQPCGRSAAMELGWACGAGKITVALLEDGQEPELMLKMADKICVSLDEVFDYLESAPMGPNPKRYEIASRPHSSESEATNALGQYLAEVSRLREKYRIPEVVIVAATRYINADKQETVCQAASFGNQRFAPELAACAFGTYVTPILERARNLESIAANGEEVSP